MLGIELVVVGITELSTEQWQVGFAYYQRAVFAHKSCHGSLSVQLSCVLQSFVVVAESAYCYASQSVGLLYVDVEVTHKITCKVIARQFKH